MTIHLLILSTYKNVGNSIAWTIFQMPFGPKKVYRTTLLGPCKERVFRGDGGADDQKEPHNVKRNCKMDAQIGMA